MWNAKIAEKKYVNGNLIILVAFNDGTNEFTESVTLMGGDMLALSQRIQARLNNLNQISALSSSVITGAFTATVIPVLTPQQDFVSKYVALQAVTRGVNFGIIQKTDKLYTDALTAAQAAFDPSFVSNL